MTSHYTPGRGKIVPCNVIYSNLLITFDYFGMAYKDSDYTVVATIATMRRHKIKIIVLKLTLVAEIQALLSRRWPPLLDRSLRRWLPIQSYGGPTKILTTPPRDHCRSLMLTCRNSPCWRSCERCNKFLSSLWTPLPTQSTERGPHVTCALIGMSCNE